MVAALDEEPVRRTSRTNRTREMMLGTLAGVGSTICSHPWDTLKVRMQLGGYQQQARGSIAKTMNSPTMVGLACDILRAEGMQGLFRGLLPPVLTAGIKSGAMFWSKAVWCRVLQPFARYDPAERTDYVVLTVAGFLTGVTVSPLHTVSDLVKIRQQGTTSVSTKAVGGEQTTIGMARSIIANEGWGALTVGLTATTLRHAFAFSALFSGYELIAETLSPKQKPEGYVALAAGGIMGALSWTISLPWDVVKTKMQMDPVAFPSFATTCRQIAAEGGVFGFWAGYNAVVIRAIVFNASFFWFYEAFGNLVPFSQ
mmetsp:Transcript_36852/g.59784  ORF Transcript_36852/g.59784 Transcript_36852/m.59784 type:complete len:313 (-) Transcript_36852:329-1267(-)